MQKKIKELFEDDRFFAITMWCSILLSIPFVIVVFLSYTDKVILMSAAIRLTTSVCLFVAYYSYRKHSKNIMKGMIGSVLMGYMCIIYSSFFAYDDFVITLVIAILMLVFAINHYIINGEHHSNPVGVYISQFLGMFFAIILCLEAALLVPDCVNTGDTIVQLLMCVAQPSAIFCIICIETRIDSYKLKRENAA